MSAGPSNPFLWSFPDLWYVPHMYLLISTLLITQGRPSVDPQIFSLFTSLLSGALSLQFLPRCLCSIYSLHPGELGGLLGFPSEHHCLEFFQDGSSAITGLTSFVASFMGISVFHCMASFVLKAIVSYILFNLGWFQASR